jgi:hypothetical protein
MAEAVTSTAFQTMTVSVGGWSRPALGLSPTLGRVGAHLQMFHNLLSVGQSPHTTVANRPHSKLG